MNNITTAKNTLPASVAEFASFFAPASADLSTGSNTGFPVISIKGKVFTLIRGDEKTLIPDPNSEDEAPARSIEVVIIRANPGKAKTYYATGYEEGSVAKPDCYSNDSIAPADDAQTPQAAKCATCAHNVWGSKITENGKKSRACSDVKRLAIAPAGQVNDPMLLRVPPGSFIALENYVDELKKRGRVHPMVVTKIGFDFTVAHQALTFKYMRDIADVETLATIKEQFESDMVARIIGTQSAPGDNAHADADAPAEDAPEAAPAPTPAPAPKATKPAKAKASVFGAVASAEAAPKANVNVEEDPETPAPAKPAKAKAKPTPVAVDNESLGAELDALLQGEGFDED